jgi:hypothetical protein
MIFVKSKSLKVMGNKNFKYLQFSVGNFALNFTDSKQNKTQVGGKWLPYVLMVMALVLWIIFNIMAIESYQFYLYPLVIMNLILYCVVAVMADPNKYTDSKNAHFNEPKQVRE